MDESRIQIYQKNPRYWQYRGKPVVLLGGSIEDNLFQIPNLREHLDLLASVGGNYIRNTMSSRDEGDVWPFAEEGGVYDLNKPSVEYWRRFENMLKLTDERGIIPQIELWDRFDFARNNWERNPYNPKNNINYTVEESGLKETIMGHPGKQENAFFRSPPALENNQTVLRYQQAQVDKMLSISLQYGNVLYCMDNETNESAEWGAYWANYIKEKAAEAGVEAHTTEMWDAYNLMDDHHKRTYDHPEIYTFCDISQNNHNRGQSHWDNIENVRAYLTPIRPINSVKIYGSDEPYRIAPPGARDGIGGRYGRDRDGLERFWRQIFSGMASSRFHRPTSGLGLTEKAQAHIKSMRMLLGNMDIFTCEPHNDLLSNRKENGAYVTANLGKEYAVYFPNGEPVDIDLSGVKGSLQAKWLDIEQSKWTKEETLEAGGIVTLTPPGTGHWAILIAAKGSGRVRISPENPRYFEYKGKPVFFTGARELEMLPRMGNYPYEQAVNALAEAGCNHWRIEMYISDATPEDAPRDKGAFSNYNQWWHDPVTGKQEHLDAFRKNTEGKYDLNDFNEPFWTRFRRFCELCAEKEIVLTLEIWSTYAVWATSPFNPKNNVNYPGPLDLGKTDKSGRAADSDFVRTVPVLDNRQDVLRYQEKFAEKVLDCTWDTGNVLYVCGNENSWPREWIEYWAEFVHKYGQAKGVDLLYGNIPMSIWSRTSLLYSSAVDDTLKRPQCDFADVSQFPGSENDPRFQFTRYETIVDWYEQSKDSQKPITILKNYIGSYMDADVGKKRREAMKDFMAGGTMSGFHRPWAGDCPEGKWINCPDKMREVYLSSLEAAKNVATFTSNVEFVDTVRRNDLVRRGWCLANPGKRYIIYLKNGGENVDVKLEPGHYSYRTFDGQRWSEENKFQWKGGWRAFNQAGNEDWGLYIVAIPLPL